MGADETDFDAFFRRTSKRLLGQAYLLTADPARAQDLTQDAFASAWVHWQSVAKYDDPEAWTRRVLHNLCISDWRKRTRSPRAVPPASSQFPPPGEDHLILLDVLRSLPTNQVKALVLHEGLGLTIAEVAAEMSAPEGTVKSWISRAKERANAALSEPGHSPQATNNLDMKEPRA